MRFILSFILFVSSPIITANAELLHSNARKEIQVSHINLDLSVNFQSRTLSGTAALKINQEKENDGYLYLDTKDLVIFDIGLGPNKVSTSYEVGKANPEFGRLLKIKVEPNTKWVYINYQTQPHAEGLQWISKEQTLGKKHPFLYSQGQTVFTRTWIPCQDDPAFRITYDALIHVPKDLMAVMGAQQKAVRKTNKKVNKETKTYAFSMKQAIPTYLIALGVGNLKFKAMSKRTGVYAEPELVDVAAKEFVDTEKMMKAAQKRYGKYRWGRYDMLILPPSFPYGGMENPRLTFLNPTVIAGDGSLVNIVAHELAHSWSGNLVTNETWEDFWLNEGTTTYLQRRILEDVYGKSFANLDRISGYKELEDALKELPEYGKSLKTNLKEKSPEDIFSSLPYEKGALFFMTLEKHIGRKDFDKFLKKYFAKFAFQTMNTAKFHAYLKKEFPKIDKKIDLNEWFYKTNIPSNAVKVSSPLMEAIALKRKAWNSGSMKTSNLDAKEWSWVEWVYFLKDLRKVPPARMEELDKQFNLSETKNSEIASEWFMATIRNGYKSNEVYKNLEEFLIRVGRSKFVKPIYKSLKRYDRRSANIFYSKARSGYHVLSQKYFDKLLNYKG